MAPDNQDYEKLAHLLAHPERWTPQDAESVRFMLANQRRAFDELHPQDAKGRASSLAVIEQMQAALDRYDAQRRS